MDGGYPHPPAHGKFHENNKKKWKPSLMHCADGHFDFSTVPNKLMLLKTGKSSFSSAS